MFRKLTLICLCLALFACSDDKSTTPAAAPIANDKPVTAGQHGPVIFQESVHYRILDKPLSDTSGNGKITVTEFFWYGCSHCRNFEPALHTWKKNLAANVFFKASPAVWSQPMELHAMAYFIAQSLLQPDEIHASLFDTIMGLQAEKNLEKHKSKLATLFAQYGLTEQDFYTQINSPEMEIRVKNAITLMQQVKVDGTPTVMVNGKYVVINTSVKNYDDILAITDFLIRKELTAGI